MWTCMSSSILQGVPPSTFWAQRHLKWTDVMLQELVSILKHSHLSQHTPRSEELTHKLDQFNVVFAREMKTWWFPDSGEHIWRWNWHPHVKVRLHCKQRRSATCCVHSESCSTLRRWLQIWKREHLAWTKLIMLIKCVVASGTQCSCTCCGCLSCFV